MRRVLYVDGSNLYGGMSELLRAGEYFDFVSLVDVIETVFPVDVIKFYGTYRTELPDQSARQRARIRGQYLFFNQARSHAKVEFKKGYFSSQGKEKGIDMQIGVDLVKDAFNDQYDEALILSGDDDFIYAIVTAQQTGRAVHLVSLASRYAFGASNHTQTQLVMDYRGHFATKVEPELRRKTKLTIVNISDTVPVLRV